MRTYKGRVSFPAFEAAQVELAASIARGENSVYASYDILVQSKCYYYSIESKFPFGKYKTSKIKDVYVLDPFYIQWCMENASGFCIAESEMQKLESANYYMNVEPVLKKEQLVNNSFKIDLSLYPKDEFDIVKISDWEGNKFSFSQMAINVNASKLNKITDYNLVLKGGDWRKKNISSDSRIFKNTLKIIILS